MGAMKRVATGRIFGARVPSWVVVRPETRPTVSGPEPAPPAAADDLRVGRLATMPETGVNLYLECGRYSFLSSRADRDPVATLASARPWRIEDGRLVLEGVRDPFRPGEALLAARRGMFGLSVWWSIEQDRAAKAAAATAPAKKKGARKR